MNTTGYIIVRLFNFRLKLCRNISVYNFDPSRKMYYKELIHPINNYNHSRKNEQSKANQTLVDLDFRVEGAVDEDKVNKNNNYEFLFVLM